MAIHYCILVSSVQKPCFHSFQLSGVSFEKSCFAALFIFLKRKTFVGLTIAKVFDIFNDIDIRGSSHFFRNLPTFLCLPLVNIENT